jgi:5'-AMP-activated protein kinase catalytic alpha subunit
MDIELTRQNILKNKHDLNTSTYYILLKKHIRLGGTSIADLSSSEFLSFLDNPLNLKDKYSINKITNKDETKKPNSKHIDAINLEKNLNCRENFINNGVYLTKSDASSNKATIETEIFNKLNNDKKQINDRREDLMFKKLNYVRRSLNQDKKITENFQEYNSKNNPKNLRNFINTSISFDNHVDLKNNTYDEKFMKTDENKHRPKCYSINSNSNNK